MKKIILINLIKKN